ncbi:hypothetical protein Tco_0615330 [Tanacetum coccineum]
MRSKFYCISFCPSELVQDLYLLQKLDSDGGVLVCANLFAIVSCSCNEIWFEVKLLMLVHMICDVLVFDNKDLALFLEHGHNNASPVVPLDALPTILEQSDMHQQLIDLSSPIQSKSK